jgi:small nuclear ribonucleoprotein (snRNP)-like protein
MLAELISDPFALCLVFYDRYRRGKLLNPDFYGQVQRVYEKKPDTLMKGLEKKYNYVVPKTVSLSHLQRLFAVYAVPEGYQALIMKRLCLRNDPKLTLDAYLESSYDPSHDVSSASFNAVTAFAQLGKLPKHLTPPEQVPGTTAHPVLLYDNLNKTKHLVFKDIAQFEAPDRTFIDAMRVQRKQREASQDAQKPHVFQTLIDSVLKKHTTTGDNRSSSSSADNLIISPFRVVRDVMELKGRAQIIVRRKGGIRGCITGFIKAADRHLNLLLTDVDELAVAPGVHRVSMKALRREMNKQQPTMSVSASAGSGGITPTKLRRKHFDQVLLRGDNVVLIQKIHV